MKRDDVNKLVYGYETMSSLGFSALEQILFLEEFFP